MKKVLVGVLVLVIAGGIYWRLGPTGQAGATQKLTLYGNVDIREVNMAFRAAGRINALYFEEGDAVQAGDLLATLDPAPQRDALAIAQANLDAAMAKLALLKSGARPQEIEQAKAKVRESHAALANAQQEFHRQVDLVAKKLGNRKDLDEARSSKDQWAARLAQAEEALALAQEGFRSEEIAQAEAALAATEAQHQQAQTFLNDTRLYAVSSGTVTTRVYEPGAMVAVGSPVYALSLNDKTYVRAYVEEPELGNAVPGATVTIATDSNDKRYRGQIGFVSPRAEFTPKSVETEDLRSDLVYRLRIVVGNPDAALRQGMPVTVTLEP